MGALILFLTTFIWGTAFLAQKLSSDTLGPFTVTCFRNVFGGAFLVLCVLLRNRFRHCPGSGTGKPFGYSVKGGVFCGISLFAAMVSQQIGIKYTTPGISAFLTTNYMFMLPVMCILLFRRIPRWHIWTGVMMAILGTYFICMVNETMTIGRGELWTILCAFLFSVQMLFVDHYARRCDLLVMSASQLFTAAVLAAPFVLLPSEASNLHLSSLFTLHSSLPVLYLGIFSSGIAYTLQNYGQARTPPAVAGVILSMESVFGALSGYVVLGDRMSTAQFAGCSLVFIAAVFTQIFDIISCKPKEQSHA